MKRIQSILFLLLVILTSVCAQYTALNAHSHNDYMQKKPFFLAYQQHFGSIEADIWEVDGDLLVAHDKENITPERTLDAMYILPIVKLFRQNKNKAWANYRGSFLLLIDIKSAYETTLPLLVEKIKKYPDVFDSKINKNAVEVVITGNRPAPADFSRYPDFIRFDGKLSLKYTEPQLKRIALYSENLALLSSWKGIDPIPETEKTRLIQLIDSVHRLKHCIRFWNAPDSPVAWKTLMNLQVDYINTDHIQELSEFLKR